MSVARPVRPLSVPCPACDEAPVALDVIEESQRLLAVHGLCVGPASYECPCLFFASLAPRR